MMEDLTLSRLDDFDQSSGMGLTTAAAILLAASRNSSVSTATYAVPDSGNHTEEEVAAKTTRGAEVTTGMSESDQSTVGRPFSVMPFDGPGSYLIRYGAPIILVISLINNGTTLAVLWRPRVRAVFSSVYMIALSVSDTGCLVLSFLEIWLPNMFNLNLSNKSRPLCKTLRTLTPAFKTLSAWLTVCIAVGRLIVVALPFRARTLCNRRSEGIMTACAALLSFGINLFPLFLFDLNAEGYCLPQPSFGGAVLSASGLLYTAMSFVLPVGILTICSLATICSLRSSYEARKKLTMEEKKKNSESSSTLRHFTKTSMAICLSYILLTLPFNVTMTVIVPLPGQRAPPSHLLAQAVTTMIALLNYGTNIYLYGMTSSLFLEELKGVLKFRSGEHVKNSEKKTESKMEPRTC